MEKWHQRLFTFSIDALELTLKLLHLGQKISVRKLVSKWRLWIYLYLRDDAIGWPVFFCLEFDHIWCQYSLSLIAQGSQVVYNFEIQGWLSEDSGLAGSDICRSVSLDVVTVLVHHLPGVGEDFSPITNGKYCCTTVIIRLLLSVALISSNFNKKSFWDCNLLPDVFYQRDYFFTRILLLCLFHNILFICPNSEQIIDYFLRLSWY